jgi:hypothetical protein
MSNFYTHCPNSNPSEELICNDYHIMKQRAEKAEARVKELEHNIRFLVDEIFYGVKLMEGSVVGNYLEWVKSLRNKLKRYKLKQAKAEGGK